VSSSGFPNSSPDIILQSSAPEVSRGLGDAITVTKGVPETAIEALFLSEAESNE